jgi:hypothetical protein
MAEHESPAPAEAEAAVDEINEAEAFSKLSPEVAAYVRDRLSQERLSMDRERERIVHAMNDEILYMKQRHLYDICGQMRELSLRDPNRAKYEEMYSDVFCRFGQKHTRQKMRRKPKFQKTVADLSFVTRPFAKSDIIMDLNGITRPPPPPPPSDDLVLMTTKGGQKWIAKKTSQGNGVLKLTYCDGSSSLLTESDAVTLGITFSAVPGK